MGYDQPMRSMVALLALPLLTACVTKGDHEAAMADAANRLQVAQRLHQTELAASQAQIVSLQGEVVALQNEITQRDTSMQALQKQLDDATALNAQLSDELRKAGTDVDQLLAEKGDLSKTLGAAKKRLEELRKAQRAAQQRADLFRSLLLKFKKMIDSGELKILLRDGRMVLQLRNDVLFDSGKVSIKDEGKEALTEVASVLATLSDRKLQVAGHTDDVPISTQRFPSNWELSAARAVNVVKFLVEKGVNAEALSAAGYSEYDPVGSNEQDDGKAKNRRIEIVLQPNIAELVQIPLG
jgi:chemotaxis protein MotB